MDRYLYICIVIIKRKKMKVYEIMKENSKVSYGDNKTRYYSLTDKEYFDNKSPLNSAKEYAKKKGYNILRVVSGTLKRQDKDYSLN